MIRLRGRHRGEDVYVLGSGASLDWLDPGFFAGRVTVGVNLVALAYTPTRYTVTKYHHVARRVADALPGSMVVVSRHLHGDEHEATADGMPPNVVVFDHVANRGDAFRAIEDWPNDPDGLVVSWSTITSAMHLAAYMGAANVILAGHDAGAIDGRTHVRGYPTPENRGQWAPFADETAWLARIEQDSLEVRAELERRYGCRVLSLSPFLTPNLDGRRYERGQAVAA